MNESETDAPPRASPMDDLFTANVVDPDPPTASTLAPKLAFAIASVIALAVVAVVVIALVLPLLTQLVALANAALGGQ